MLYWAALRACTRGAAFRLSLHPIRHNSPDAGRICTRYGRTPASCAACAAIGTANQGSPPQSCDSAEGCIIVSALSSHRRAAAPATKPNGGRSAAAVWQGLIASLSFVLAAAHGLRQGRCLCSANSDIRRKRLFVKVPERISGENHCLSYIRTKNGKNGTSLAKFFQNFCQTPQTSADRLPHRPAGDFFCTGDLGVAFSQKVPRIDVLALLDGQAS